LAYTVLLDEVADRVQRGELEVTPGLGPEQIAFTIWSTVHRIAVLEGTDLPIFAAEIQASADDGLRRLLAGVAQPGS